MRRSLSTALVLGLALGACSEGPVSPELDGTEVPTAEARVRVNSTGSDGAGSLREALAEAESNRSINRIELPGGTIEVDEPLTFAGSQNLKIEGNGTVLDFSGLGEFAFGRDGLVFTGGGNVRVSDLTIRNAPGNGMVVLVPADARGTIQVDLRDTRVAGNGLHGVWVDDQTNNSDANVLFRARDVEILENGFEPSVSDYDGVRVDEGGRGNLIIDLEGMMALGNAGDGNEYDERGPGDVESYVENSVFNDNGDQPQNPDDLEDGFDIDEADAGSIYAEFEGVQADGNEDEGIDLDESGDGDIVIEAEDVSMADNRDGNFTATEGEDDVDAGIVADGGVFGEFENVISTRSRTDDGFKLEEFGPGDFDVSFENVTVVDNFDDGVTAEQLGEGTGVLRVEDSDVSGNGDDQYNLDGVELVEGD